MVSRVNVVMLNQVDMAFWSFYLKPLECVITSQVFRTSFWEEKGEGEFSYVTQKFDLPMFITRSDEYLGPMTQERQKLCK